MIIETDDYISLPEKAKTWGLSKARIYHFLYQERLKGAIKIGGIWFVPKNLEKPVDERYIPRKDRCNTRHKVLHKNKSAS